MAQYKGMQSVLNEALGEFKDCGFSLVELDNHFLELHFKGIKVATYHQPKATIEIIRGGCKRFLSQQ